MRSLTGGETTLLATAAKRLAYKVEIQDEVAAWQDFTSLSGVDWVLGIEGSDSIDEPIQAVTVELRRDHAGLSLSPFRGDSSLNAGGAAIDVGRGIRVSVAYAAWGASPAGGDYRMVHVGIIDTIDFSQPNITLRSRMGVGAMLVDNWVREVTEYGTDVGRRLDLVIQDIITAHTPGATLDVPVLPAFVVVTYSQQPESVWDAIRALAALIGWDIRILWNTSAGAFRPTLVQPDRAKVVPDYTFAPDFIYGVDQLSIDRTFIRNSIRVTYVDVDGVTQHEDGTDPTSIARFGEQWAEIIFGTGSPINTAPEALDVLAAALADLAWPIADQVVQVPYFWPLEIGDLDRFSANGIHYNSAQDLAATGHRWVIRPKAARSFITVRGKPAGFYLNWLDTGTPIDFSTVPYVTSCATLFAVDNTVKVHVVGNQLTRSDLTNESIIVTVTTGAPGATTPADPTLGANDGFITSRDGTITTSVTCPVGDEAAVKARAVDVDGNLGPVVGVFRAINTGAQVPAISARLTFGANGDTCDIFVTVTSPVGEDVRLSVKLAEGATPYALVVGAADSTPLYVSSGTELGPTDYFHNGSGFAQSLNDLALIRDQVDRIYLLATGEDTGLSSLWVPLTLELSAMPWLESVVLEWDDVMDRLLCTSKGGARCASVKVEFSDDSSFATVDDTSYANLADGGTLLTTYTISSSLRDKLWYVRVTPYNGALSGGVPTLLAGQPQTGQCFVTGNVSKKLKIAAAKFDPAVSGQTYAKLYSIYPAIASAASGDFCASVELPAATGVVITGMRLRASRTASAAPNEVRAQLIRYDDSASGTIIGTCTHTGTGFSTTSTTSLSEDTTGFTYVLYAYIESTAGNTSRLVYVELDYTMPDYQAAV